MKNAIEQIVIDLISKRLEYPSKLISDTMQNSVRTEYASDTYSYLEGFYSPSPFEIICCNLKRGRLLTRPRHEHTGFKYFFDEKNELVLIARTNRGIIDYVIIYEKQDGHTVGYLYYLPNGDIAVGGRLNRIILTRSERKQTTMYSITAISPEVVQEDLCVKNNMILTSEFQEYKYEGDKAIELINHYRVYSCKEGMVKTDIIREHNLVTGDAIQHNRKVWDRLRER